MNGINGHERAYRGLTNEWYTPSYIINSLGIFDLDPCAAPKEHRPFETATKSYTITDDGLKQAWEGRVWLNPPYGELTKHWLKRMSEHSNGIVLIFARTETKMFFDYVWPYAKAFFFFKGRIKFLNHIGKTGPAGGPSVLIAYDKDSTINTDALKNCKLPGQFLQNINPEIAYRIQGESIEP